LTEGLEIRAVSKTFVRKTRQGESRLNVLEEITLAAGRGEFVTIIGPSGCGKSTLLNCIAGLTSYDAGQILVGGSEVRGPGADRAVVFQQASLLPWRTVERNIAYGLELRREFGAQEISRRVADAIERVGLTGFERHYPYEISGGMQQRANLARALAVDSDLILMDEPFGALDALTKETLQDDLSAMIGKIDRTTVFITHDISEAAFLGDKVLVMSARPGRIVAEIEVPFARPRHRNLTTTGEFEEVVSRMRELLRPETVSTERSELPSSEAVDV
jgi:NitT/TauT family transport system ATP-binding protein